MKAEEILEKFAFYDNITELVYKEDAIIAMEEYAEQRIREELVKFCEHFEIELDPIDRDLIIYEYLKQKK